jgi:hypothetical protein
MEPLQPCWKELSRFVESSTELSKTDLINRCAFKVSYYAITMLKLLEFHRIGKTSKGKLYIV